MSNEELLSKLAKKLEQEKESNVELNNLISALTDLLELHHNKPLTTKEVCNKYQISRRTLSRKIKSGELLPVSNIGGNRFDEKDIRNLQFPKQ